MTCRGFSLVETLVAFAIASVIAMGSLHSLKFALQAGAVSRSILTENDFRLTVSNALDKNCTANLSPTTQLEGNHKEIGIGTVNQLFLEGDDPNANPPDPPIIKVGIFKGDIEVVKMEVTGNDQEAIDDKTVKREFVAYYKKTNLGDLNTVAGGKCEKTGETYKLSGCFKTQCKLNYEFGDDPDTDGDQTDHFRGCQSLTCHPIVLQVAGSRFPCKWGLLYRPGGDPECDPVEKTTEGECNKQKTNKEVDGDTCKCKPRFKLTADGRCIAQRYAVTSGNFNSSQACYKLENTTEEGKKGVLDSFCQTGTDPPPYRGSFNCIYWENPGADYSCSGEGILDNHSVDCRLYWRRFYNRETGQVHCVSYKALLYKNPLPEQKKENRETEKKAISTLFSVGPQTQ